MQLQGEEAALAYGGPKKQRPIGDRSGVGRGRDYRPILLTGTSSFLLSPPSTILPTPTLVFPTPPYTMPIREVRSATKGGGRDVRGKERRGEEGW